MNVEDSYEGAVRRLARLGYAGVHIAQHRDENDHRMRELEELATLACDENERLGGELADARREIERLRATVVSLQQQQLAAMVRPPADEIEYAPRKGRSGAFYFVVLAMLGAGAAALFAARPWERGRVAIAMASLDKPAPTVTPPPPAPPIAPTPAAPTPAVTTATVPTAPVAPVVVAPPVAPKIAAVIPTVQVPKIATTIPKASAAPSPSPKAKHHAAAAKRHAHKSPRKHGAAAHRDDSTIHDTSDPLAGTNL